MAGESKRGGKDVVLGGRHLVGFFFLLVVVLGVVFTLGYLLGRSQYDTQLRASAGNVAAEPLERVKSALDGLSKPSSASKSDDPESTDAAANSVGTANHLNDNSPKLKAAAANAKSADAPAAPAAGADWDFYHSAEPAKTDEKLSPPPSKKPQVLSASNRLVANGAASDAVGNGKPLNSPLIPRGSTVLQVAALAREADALSLAQALQQKKFPAFVLPPDADHFYRVQVGPYTDAKAANAARQRLDKAGFKYIIKR